MVPLALLPRADDRRQLVGLGLHQRGLVGGDPEGEDDGGEGVLGLGIFHARPLARTFVVSWPVLRPSPPAAARSPDPATWQQGRAALMVCRVSHCVP